MKSYYSIIRFVNNPLSKENLAIGMIVISKGDVFYKFSKEKVHLAQKINRSNANLLSYSIDKISNFIDNQLKEEVSLFEREASVNLDYLNRLSIYNNGFFQFDKPSIINIDFNKEKFNDFFGKYIELNRRSSNKAIVDRSFARIIDQVFYKPLQNVIDIDYKVKKEQVPGLFFDYKLDGIGVNGSIYTVKSLDLNADKPIDSYRKDISELESLNYRLDLFSKENNLDSNANNHYLVIDPYIGSKPSYKNLYDILQDQEECDYPYSVINTKELAKVTSAIKHSSSIMKFSDFIGELA